MPRDPDQFPKEGINPLDPVGTVAVGGLKRVVLERQRVVVVVPGQSIVDADAFGLGEHAGFEIHADIDRLVCRRDDRRGIGVVDAIEHVDVIVSNLIQPPHRAKDVEVRVEFTAQVQEREHAVATTEIDRWMSKRASRQSLTT